MYKYNCLWPKEALSKAQSGTRPILLHASVCSYFSNHPVFLLSHMYTFIISCCLILGFSAVLISWLKHVNQCFTMWLNWVFQFRGKLPELHWTTSLFAIQPIRQKLRSLISPSNPTCAVPMLSIHLTTFIINMIFYICETMIFKKPNITNKQNTWMS